MLYSGQCHAVQVGFWGFRIPHRPGLQIYGGTRKDRRSDAVARLAAVHDALRDGGELAVWYVSQVCQSGMPCRVASWCTYEVR
jgi:hypothetical protein